LPLQVQDAILFEHLALLEEERSLLKAGCPFEHIVGSGVFDIAEERIKEV
jgi:hypothetical protein